MIKPFDLNGLTTYDLRLAALEGLRRGSWPAGRRRPAAAVGDWLDGLPRQLAANDLRSVRDHLCRACDAGRTVVAALGGHVIKTGCGPYLIDWIRSGLAQGGGPERRRGHSRFRAGAGRQDQRGRGAPAARPGQFGMARETADAFAVAAHVGAENETGLGAALGRLHRRSSIVRMPTVSLVLAAYRAGIPCTVHVALGTDIVHMHPHVSGAALGEASLIDFRRLCTRRRRRWRTACG